MSSATQIPATELLELCPAGFSTRGKANIAVVAVLLPLAFFMVTVRLFVRKKITRALWWDDLALVIALVGVRHRSSTFTIFSLLIKSA